MRARAIRDWVAALAVVIGFSAPACSEVLVLRGFTLIDGTGHAPLPHAAMVIDDGRIRWVGLDAKLKTPAGARTIVAAGKYVIPGLIDTHVHLGVAKGMVLSAANQTRDNIDRQLATYASYGVTTVQSLGTEQDIVLQMRDEERAHRTAKTRIFSAGLGVVFDGGYGGLAGVTKKVATPAEADAAVAREAGRHVDLIKFWLDDEMGTLPKMPPQITKAVIDGAHNRGFRVVSHIFYLQDAKRVIGQGVDGLSHSVRDQPIDTALIDGMKRHHSWQMAATLSREKYLALYGSRPAFLDDPFFTQALEPGVLAALADPARAKAAAAAPHFDQFEGFFETAAHNLKREADAGIPYAMGTDAGAVGRFPGYSEHIELELMVQAGLTPMQVLVAATSSGAKFLHDSTIGSIEPGKWADFVILDGNPLVDIRNSRTIDAVYIAGTQVPSIKR